MKTKKDFLLRKLGKEYIVVAVGDAGKNFNGMIRLNETGAFFWKELEKGISEDELVAKMLERFADLDAETAREDLKEFLNTIEIAVDVQNEQHD